jgi:hypothetical protein
MQASELGNNIDEAVVELSDLLEIDFSRLLTSTQNTDKEM